MDRGGFEIWYPRVRAKIIEDRQACREENSGPLSPEFVEHEVVIEMRYMMVASAETTTYLTHQTLLMLSGKAP